MTSITEESTTSIASEVLAASIGGAISATVLYPLEVVKTKMQAAGQQETSSDSVSSSSSSSEGENSSYDKVVTEEEEGGGDIKSSSSFTMVEFTRDLFEKHGNEVFWEGVGTSAFQSACEKALYFCAYTFLKNNYSGLKGGSNRIGTVENLILGSIAEWCHLPFTLPIDCLTTAIQTNPDKNLTSYQIMMSLMSQKDGIRGMYKGVEAYTVLCLKPAIQYTVYEQIKQVVLVSRRKKQKNRHHSSLSVIESFILGMVARAIATIIVFPYTRAKVMIQASSSQKNSSTATTIPKMLMEMYNTKGASSLFQGLGPELTRGVLSSALMLMIKEQIGDLVKIFV